MQKERTHFGRDLPQRKKDFNGTGFFRFFQCPLAVLGTFRKRKDRAPHVEEEEYLSGRLRTERVLIKKQYKTAKEVKIDDPEQGWKTTEKLMRTGTPVIYRGWIMAGDHVGRPTILERRPGPSAFGPFYYQPVRVKRCHALRKEDRCQLAFYARILESIQRVLPTESAILSPDLERLTFPLADFLTEFQSILETLERIRMGEKPDLVFRKPCRDTSPWGCLCKRGRRGTRQASSSIDVVIAALREFELRASRTQRTWIRPIRRVVGGLARVPCDLSISKREV